MIAGHHKIILYLLTLASSSLLPSSIFSKDKEARKKLSTVLAFFCAHDKRMQELNDRLDEFSGIAHFMKRDIEAEILRDIEAVQRGEGNTFEIMEIMNSMNNNFWVRWEDSEPQGQQQETEVRKKLAEIPRRWNDSDALANKKEIEESLQCERAGLCKQFAEIFRLAPKIFVSIIPPDISPETLHVNDHALNTYLFALQDELRKRSIEDKQIKNREVTGIRKNLSGRTYQGGV